MSEQEGKTVVILSLAELGKRFPLAMERELEQQVQLLTSENHELNKQLAEANARYHRDVKMYPDERIQELTLQLSKSDMELVGTKAINRKLIEEILQLKCLLSPQL